MARQMYVEKRFSVEHTTIIAQANTIIADYQSQGYTLTLRQLYYQFVSRAFIPNTLQSYKRLGSIINDGRLAGRIDWDAIEDRTRNLQSVGHWTSPGQIIRACANQYRVDRWKGQNWRPEVWIEKEALAGVIEGICRELDVSYFSCRGYTSQSEMRSAAERFLRFNEDGQDVLLIHLGDHDPSGIDMTRDIIDRLEMFMGDAPRVERIALNMPQIREFNPPPNPAKTTDSRADNYIREFGDESWELDALEPAVITQLIRDTVEEVIDQDLWDARIAEEDRGRQRLQEIATSADA